MGTGIGFHKFPCCPNPPRARKPCSVHAARECRALTSCFMLVRGSSVFILSHLINTVSFQEDLSLEDAALPLESLFRSLFPTSGSCMASECGQRTKVNLLPHSSGSKHRRSLAPGVSKLRGLACLTKPQGWICLCSPSLHSGSSACTASPLPSVASSS